MIGNEFDWSQWKCFTSKVIVKLDKEPKEEVTSSGIIIPAYGKTRPYFGEVVCVNDYISGVLEVKVGDNVMFQYESMEHIADKYWAIPPEDMMAEIKQ